MHNYKQAVLWLIEHGDVPITHGTSHLLSVQHDDTCGVFRHKLCDCRPNILLDGKRLHYPDEALRGN